MANPTTSSQWAQSASDLKAQQDAVSAQLKASQQQSMQLTRDSQALFQQMQDANNSGNDTKFAQAQAAREKVKAEKAAIDAQSSTLAEQHSSLQDQINSAQNQASIAASGPSNTNVTPPPATSTPAQLPSPITPSPEKAVASDLSTVKQADGTYTVVDTTKGVELYNSNTPEGANTYVSSVANGRSHEDAVGNANTVDANPGMINQSVQSFGAPTATDYVGPTNTNNQVQAFGTPTATDYVGPTNTNNQVQAFGTPTATDYVGPTNTNTDVQAFGTQKTGETSATPVPVQESLGPGEELVKVDPNSDPAAPQAATTQNTGEDRPAGEKIIKPSEDAALAAQESNASDAAAKADSAAKSNSEQQQSDAASNGNIASSVDSVRIKPVMYVQRNTIQKDDWRLRLSLATTANYLYKANDIKPNDLLYPLAATDGVVFPYTPQINSAYRANYDPADLTHSNYKMFFYKNSSVDDITITADFTAQDTAEANYLLAVIHFFKSVTKMFYGQDGKTGGPSAGTPPPLCYLNGLGAFQYSEHPVLISSFTYNLPNDVDYIRAGFTFPIAGQSTAQPPKVDTGWNFMSLLRSKASNLTKGAVSKEPNFSNLANSEATYVPTKIQLQLTLLPVVTRADISNNFSLSDYAKGKLTRGSQRNGGGIW